MDLAIERPHVLTIWQCHICYVGHHREHNITNRHQQHRDPESNPDIIFATNRIAGCCNKIVMEPVPRSQHRPIGVQVNADITVQTVPFRRRFNLKKANWSNQLDTAVENIPATAECYDQFMNALRKVARNNIPHWCRRNYVPGLTPESIELIKEYREKYEDDPFADRPSHSGRN